MKHRLLRSSQIFVVFLLLAVVFGTAGISGAVIAAPSNAVVGAEVQGGNISTRMDTVNGKTWQAATKPWTKERMQAAKPMDMSAVQGERALSIELSTPTGAPGVHPSALPANAKQISIGIDELDQFTQLAPLGYSYPAPFTRYRHFQPYAKFPYMTAGVLFFTQYGIDYRCSAASIGNYAIWTAGHCVHAGNGLFSGWSYDVVFYPAYLNGVALKGAWAASTLWTTTHWYNNGQYDDLRLDLGGAVLYTNGSGQKISQVVGNLGFAYNQPKGQHWMDLGYPVTSPFNGKYMQICAASFAYSDTSMGTPTPTGIGCDMTGGSSGGPWIMNFSGVAGATNYLNGHNDYRYAGYLKEMFSPYFGTNANSLWGTLIASTP